MSRVRLIKDQQLGSTPQTWSLVREGTGPGRGEGTGFRSVKEAEEFAARYGHEITERQNRGSLLNGALFGAERGAARYGTRANAKVKVGDRVLVMSAGSHGEGVVDDVAGSAIGSNGPWFWVLFDDGTRDQYPETKLMRVPKGMKNDDAREKCFACGKPLGANPALADTRDGQTAYVGSECWAKVAAAGERGWQPPRGGPRLWAGPSAKENAGCDHQDVEWSGRWDQLGKDQPRTMIGRCRACGQRVSTSGPHNVAPYDNPYWTGPDGERVKRNSPERVYLFRETAETGPQTISVRASSEAEAWEELGRRFDSSPEYCRSVARLVGVSDQGRNNASPVQAMALLIDGDLGRESIPVADVRDASAKYRAYVEANDLGASQVDFGKVVMGGRLVATVSYNGRVTLENAGLGTSRKQRAGAACGGAADDVQSGDGRKTGTGRSDPT